MTFIEEALTNRKRWHLEKGRPPSLYIIPLSREFDLDPDEYPNDDDNPNSDARSLAKRVKRLGAPAVIKRLFGTPVIWADVPAFITI